VSIIVPEIEREHEARPTSSQHQETEGEQEAWTRAYWLGRCEGYRVDLPTGGYVGYVEKVLWSTGKSDPVALEVWSSRGAEVMLVPIEHVCRLAPLAERVVIDDIPSP
jgi:hypothetical protein